MIKVICLLAFLLETILCSAQTTFLNFGDSQRIVVNDVEFGYSILVNEPKEIDGVTYQFLKLRWFITNKDRFSKIFVIDEFSPDQSGDFRKIHIGRIHVRNALKNAFSEIVEEPNVFLKIFRRPGIPIPVIFRRKNEIPAFYLKSASTLDKVIEINIPKDQKPDIELQAFLSKVY